MSIDTHRGCTHRCVHSRGCRAGSSEAASPHQRGLNTKPTPRARREYLIVSRAATVRTFGRHDHRHRTRRGAGAARWSPGPTHHRAVRPADITPADVAVTLSELLGRTVTVVGAPLDAVVPPFMSFGVSQHMAEIYRGMYEGFLNGVVTWENAGDRVRGSIDAKEGLRALIG
jgi:hypothetical protein